MWALTQIYLNITGLSKLVSEHLNLPTEHINKSSLFEAHHEECVCTVLYACTHYRIDRFNLIRICSNYWEKTDGRFSLNCHHCQPLNQPCVSLYAHIYSSFFSPNHCDWFSKQSPGCHTKGKLNLLADSSCTQGRHLYIQTEFRGLLSQSAQKKSSFGMPCGFL